VAPKLNASQRLFLKGTIPAGWPVIPRPHEDPALDHDDPDAGVAMLGSGTDTEDLRFREFLKEWPRESSCGGHVLEFSVTNSSGIGTGREDYFFTGYALAFASRWMS
jgi:hypothetical protein